MNIILIMVSCQDRTQSPLGAGMFFSSFSKVERTHFHELSSYSDNNLKGLRPLWEKKEHDKFKTPRLQKNLSNLNERGFLGWLSSSAQILRGTVKITSGEFVSNICIMVS